MAGICSGPGPCDVTPLGTGKNWVTKVGGLPLYIRAIAHALRRSGHSQGDSIQLAIGTVQRWARGGGNVTDATRGRAAAALAEWERKRAEAHLSGSDAVSIDLAYQWKHGWIPLTPAALAIKLGKSHGHADGVKADDARKALGTNKHFREGFEKGRAEVKGRSFSPGDLRESARKHEAAAATHLQHPDDRFYPDATKDATREAGHAAALRHEAALSQRRFHAANSGPLHVRKDDGSMGTADNKTRDAVRRYQKANPNVPHVQLSGGNRMSVDLASQSQLLPDMDSVRKAASKLSKLPPPLRKSMVARLQARAKQLGATLNLSTPTGRYVDLAVDQAQRDTAKSAGLTFPGTDSFPLAGPDGKFDRGLATKAVRMVQLSNAASAPAIRKWLMTKLKANGATDLIPSTWNADGSTSS